MTGTRTLSLADLADAAGMTPRNVRAYQSKGLLPPPHRNGRSATYGPEHVARLRLVRSLHRHGLSLLVIRGLLDLGTADAELARLSRDRLLATWGRDELVPMTLVNVDAFEREYPGLLDAMARAGLVVREDGRVRASATGLGLVSALLARDVELEVSTQVALAAAEAADATLPALRQQLDEGGGGLEVTRLVVQLAATAYSDVLARRLGLW